MMSDLLSQDEINALLSGGLGGGDEPAAQDSASLSPADEKALKEISSVFSTSLQSVFGMLTGKDVSVKELGISTVAPIEVVSSVEPAPFVLRAQCGGLGGEPLAIIIPQMGAQLLSDMMMGGEGKDLSGVLNELDISASQEGVSQVIGSAFTNLSSKLKGERLMPEGIAAKVEAEAWELFPGAEYPDVCSIKLLVSVSGASDFEMFVALPKSVVHTFAEHMAAAEQPPAAPAPAAAAPKPQVTPPQQQAPQPQFGAPSMPQSGGFGHGMQQPSPIVDVRPAEFSPLTSKGGSGGSSRIDLVADIPVRVTVELGRTRKNISEVLGMAAGSIIELDKMAGEPVDVLVNGKLIAKGEVVVIDENFGVRVTEIINSVSRAYS